MPVARTACRAQLGLHAPLVQVEVSLGSGLPAFCIVGLPATVIKESKERVRAALTNSGFGFPAGRITVSLAPAELPKEGGRFDLPIALGILLASGQLRAAASERSAEFYGELGLTGELKPVRGLTLAAVHARAQGAEMIVPRGNAAEASLVWPRHVHAAAHLLEVCAHVSGERRLSPHTADAHAHAHRYVTPRASEPELLDLADVRGQCVAKRALIIAAAGSHSLLLIGPPGSGKTMLAHRLAGLLPALTETDALEVAAIVAASAGDLRAEQLRQRPFRAPHHTSS
ncbi:MAG: ATP-binding protein, partial [Gammaproteobacteria bacterium]|nr:ATP-binding protein [Gammaproteobacteria bacterium]